MTYRYAATDPRPDRERYFYSPFEGPDFLEAYRESRMATLRHLPDRGPVVDGRLPRRGTVANQDLPETSLPLPGDRGIVTVELLEAALDAGVDRLAPWLPVLIRKFEVSRALRAAYGPDLRPSDRSEAPADGYAFLAVHLARQAADPDAVSTAIGLGVLSTLLKVGDLLAFLIDDPSTVLTPTAAAAARDAYTTELELVDIIRARGLPQPQFASTGEAGQTATIDAAPPGRPTFDAGWTLLAADTVRARTYLDLLAADGLAPDRAILFETATPVALTSRPEARQSSRFDAVTPLADALLRARVATTRVRADGLNDEQVLAAVREAGPGLVVAAGPAGAILGPGFFAVPGVRYLHVHPGRLPAYRGSTPMYYQLLAEGRMTATALLLDAGIDTGLVVAEREFRPPADLTAIDGAVDPWMRALLLRDVLRRRAAGDELVGSPQPPAGAHTYFVIHPVLRHIALLSG